MEKNKYDGKIGMQHKAMPAEGYKYDGDSRKISGYAAIFNNIDKSGDKLIKGCFARSISERGVNSPANDKILLLWQHDISEPLGRITELREDDKGLYFEAIIDEIELGDRALKQLESGTLNQFSIGYNYIWESCQTDPIDGSFVVKEVKLYEISIVSIGCNGETEYLGLKSTDDINKAYKDLNNDISTFNHGISALKQRKLQEIIAKAISLSKLSPVGRPIDEEEADNNGEQKSIFSLIKRKEK